jgi:ankyrin repeat protein
MSSPPAHGSGSEGGQEEHDHLDRALQAASSDGNLAEVLALLEAGADVNGVGADDEGDTYPPLEQASMYGHLACVRALLAAGAEIDHSTTGFTALSLAVLCGKTDVVRCLLEAGASHDVGGLEEIYSGLEEAPGFNLQVLQLLRSYAPARSVALGPALQGEPIVI